MNRSTKSLIITTLAGLSLGALVGIYSLSQSGAKDPSALKKLSKQTMKFHAKRLHSMSPEMSGEEKDSAPKPSDADLPKSETFQASGDEPKAIVSQEKVFIHEALKRPLIDTKTWQDKSTGRYVKGSLVKDDGQYGYLLIRQTYEDKELQELVRETVQVGDHLMVQFDKDQSPDKLDRFLRENNLSLKAKLPLEGSYLLVSDVVSVDHMVTLEETLARTPGIRNSEPNFLYFIAAVPNDPRMGQLWGFKNDGKASSGAGGYTKDNDVKVYKVWDKATDCTNTVVAVLDTGVDYNHPDLKDNIAKDLGRNFTSNDPNDFMDRNSHGTHCSGSIGAVGNNNVGVAGVCWKAKIVPVKIMSDDGTGSGDAMMNGIAYALDQTDIRILSMSLGGSGGSNQISQLFDKALKSNKLVFAAAGNSNEDIDTRPSYPAAYPSESIISIAAFDGKGQLAGFSSYGDKNVDIASPGVDIMSTIPLSKAGGNANNAYAAYQGTSMATPIAAGLGALLWSSAPKMTNQDVRKELLARADKGNFNKPVAESRKINIESAFEALTPKASLANAKVGESVSLVNADTFDFEVKNENPYSTLKTVEILNGSEVIGKAEGEKVSAKLPFLDPSVKLSVRVTDSQGRVTTSEIGTVNIDVTKTIKLDSIDVSKNKGKIACAFERVSEKNEKTTLFQANVDTKEYCSKICDIIKPTAFTSKGKLSCGVLASSDDAEEDTMKEGSQP